MANPRDTSRGVDSSSAALLEVLRPLINPEAARAAGYDFADSFIQGAGSQASAASAMGAKIGSNVIKSISSAVTSGLSALTSAIGGNLQLGKSFEGGTQLASTIRSEMARFSFGDKNLKAYSSAVKDAFTELKQEGVIVDPNLIYGMYKQLGSLVSLTGSTEARLTSLLNVATKISESAGAYDTTTYTADYFLNNFGTKMWEGINGIGAVIQSQNKNLSDEVVKAIINDQNIGYQMIQAFGNDKDAILTAYEDMIQEIGAFANETSASTAMSLAKLESSLMSMDKTFGDIISTNGPFAAMIDAQLKNMGVNRSVESLDRDWMVKNSTEMMTAIVGAMNEMNSTFGYNDVDMSKMLRALGISDISAMDLASLNSSKLGAMSSSELRAFFNQASAAGVSQEAIDSVYQAIDKQNTVADRLNAELKIIGLDLVDDTYDNQVLGWLAVIGNGVTSLIGGAGGVGGILQSVMQGTTTGVVSGLMTGAGAAGGAGGGLLSLLGAAAPWLAGAAAVLGTAFLVVDSIKQSTEADNKAYNEQLSALREISGSDSLLARIKADTGDINDTMNPDSGSSSSSTGTYIPEYDIKGNMTGGSYISNTGSNGEDLTAQNRQQQEAAFQAGASRAAGNVALNRFDNSYEYVDYIYSKGKGLTGSGGNVTFSKAVTTADLDHIMDFVTDNPYGFTEEEIRRSLLDSYYDDDAIKALKLQKLYNGDAVFKSLIDTYYDLGLLAQDPTTGLFDWDSATTDFIGWYKQRLDEFLKGKVYFDYQGENKGYQSLNTIASWDLENDSLYESLRDPNSAAYYGNLGSEAAIKASKDWYDKIWNTDSYAALYSYAQGLDTIPYDGYPAILHEGEMVIPAKRANWIRKMLGMQLQNYSNVPANNLTGNNSFVQSIPEYSAGTDAVAFAQLNLGRPYRGNGTPGSRTEINPNGFDCSSLTSRAYGAMNAQGEIGAVTPALIDKVYNTVGLYNNLPGLGFRKVWDYIANNQGRRGDKSDLTSAGVSAGDIILYGRNRSKKAHNLNHAALVENASTQIHANGTVRRDRLYPYSNAEDHLVALFRYGGAYEPKFTSSDGTESVTDLSQIPENFQDLLKYKHYPFIAEKLRRLGYNGSGTGTSATANYGADNSAYQTNEYKSVLDKYGAQYGIDPLILYGIMMSESSGNPNANKNSASQYKGLMQINQGKVDNYVGAGADIYNPDVNVHAAAAYLKENYNKLKYWTLAVGGYNHGPNYDAWENLGGLLDSGIPWNDAVSQVGTTSSMRGNYPKVKTSYINSVYEYAGLPKIGAYLAKGGIVTDPTVTMLGEGRDDEAVIPLNKNIDYLGIQELGVNLIDALDIMTERICKRLDELINLKKQDGTNPISSMANAQKTQRVEALLNFQGRY